MSWIIGLTAVLEIAFNWNTWEQLQTTTYFNDSLAHSPYIVVAKVLTLSFMFFAVIYLDTNEPGVNASSVALIGSALFFMLILISANHFIVLYVALEGLSLLLFVLTAQTKTLVAVESGLKYFFQSSFASILLLFGIALTLAGTGYFDFVSIQQVLLTQSVSYLSLFGLSLIVIALLFKISAFPGISELLMCIKARQHLL